MVHLTMGMAAVVSQPDQQSDDLDDDHNDDHPQDEPASLAHRLHSDRLQGGFGFGSGAGFGSTAAGGSQRQNNCAVQPPNKMANKIDSTQAALRHLLPPTSAVFSCSLIAPGHCGFHVPDRAYQKGQR
jgi:hypothetical protein